jgi:hypothetical protein
VLSKTLFGLIVFSFVYMIAGFDLTIVLAAEPNYITEESPPDDSVREEKGPLEYLQPKADPKPPSVFPALEKKIEHLPPFWRDTSFNVHVRSYYFGSDTPGTGKKEAWALGGWLAYESGWWKDRLKIGLTGYTSQKLYGSEDRDGTLLLKPGQEGFSVLGQAYLQTRVADEINLRIYRQILDLPYINQDDSRMVPNTFEAYTLNGESVGHFDFIISHVAKMKTRNASTFRPMSEIAGFPGTDKGLTLGGLTYSLSDDIYVGAINQYSWDLWNTAYTEAAGVWDIADGTEIGLTVQYTDQRDVGDALDGVFSTSAMGAAMAFSWQGAIVSFAVSTTDDDSRIRRPYGGSPAFVSLMQAKFDRAGEDAWRAGLSFDFKTMGVDGLSAFVDYARGNTPDAGGAASPDQEEFDFTVDYQFKNGLFDGLWLRVRASFLDQHGPTGRDTDEIRLILNYDLPVLLRSD